MNDLSTAVSPFSTRQVQHLVARGKLRQVARGVLDETSVEGLVAVRGGSHKRAWSEATAWSAVALLSRAEVALMGEGQRSRLKARLRALGPAELVGRARDRAEVTRYVAHSSTGERVYAVDVAGRLGLAATNAIDGYLDTSAVDDVVSR